MDNTNNKHHKLKLWVEHGWTIHNSSWLRGGYQDPTSSGAVWDPPWSSGHSVELWGPQSGMAKCHCLRTGSGRGLCIRPKPRRSCGVGFFGVRSVDEGVIMIWKYMEHLLGVEMFVGPHECVEIIYSHSCWVNHVESSCLLSFSVQTCTTSLLIRNPCSALVISGEFVWVI